MIIKKIIAREGLIIMSVCLILLFVLFMNSREQNRKTEYDANASYALIVDGKQVLAESYDNYQKLKAAGFSDEEITANYSKLLPRQLEAAEKVKSTGIIIRVAKGTVNTNIEKTITKDFPNVSDPTWLVLADLQKVINEKGQKGYYNIKTGFIAAAPSEINKHDQLKFHGATEDMKQGAACSYDEAGNSLHFYDYSRVIFTVVFLYPAYLVARFILWAVKTIK
jgi:hypothetical protein